MRPRTAVQLFARRLLSSDAGGRAPASLKQRIQQDLLAAQRAKDGFRVSVLRQVFAELVRAEKAADQRLDEIGALQKCAQQWAAAIADYRSLSANVTDPARRMQISEAIGRESAELRLIESYLPTPYSQAELDDIIERALAELQISTPNPERSRLGMLMKTILLRIERGRVSGGALAKRVGEMLARGAEQD